MIINCGWGQSVFLFNSIGVIKFEFSIKFNKLFYCHLWVDEGFDTVDFDDFCDFCDFFDFVLGSPFFLDASMAAVSRGSPQGWCTLICLHNILTNDGFLS